MSSSKIWENITFTTRLSRRIDIVDLGDLLASILSGGIAKVNINVDTTCVIEVWSSGTLRSYDTSWDKLKGELSEHEANIGRYVTTDIISNSKMFSY